MTSQDLEGKGYSLVGKISVKIVEKRIACSAFIIFII